MKTRFSFTSNPLIFMENGHALPDDIAPSIMSCRTLFCKIIEELFITVNPPEEHVCKMECFQELQIVIGKPNELAINLVPRNGTVINII